MTNLTQSPAWRALAEHHAEIAPVQMRELFAEDPERFQRFALRLDDILFDYSKNRITAETMRLLVDLARQAGLAEAIEAMFTRQKINTTEDRAVLHVALRNRSNRPIFVDGEDVMPGSQSGAGKDGRVQRGCAVGRMAGLHRQTHHRCGQHRHRRLRPGPEDGDHRPDALRAPDIRFHFVSNVDGTDICRDAEGC